LARHLPATDLAARAGRALLDLLLPPHCAACGAPVDAPDLLCPDCFRKTGFITEPFCARCGVPLANAALGGAEHLCPGCRAAPPVFGRARAALRYDAQGRRLILPFKHADRPSWRCWHRNECATEVAGAFAVRAARAARLRGARILLVDDVMTSGATANACAAVLLAAGVASVDVLAAARVPDPRLN
jgi:predicted amidophosphoribosyltransferase